VWKTCQYYNRDGQVNPDRNTIQDFQSFFNLSDAVLYNSIASTFQNKSSSVYSQNVGASHTSSSRSSTPSHLFWAVKFINAWFLDADTAMNPNLNYAQMDGGPTGQVGEWDVTILGCSLTIHRPGEWTGILSVSTQPPCSSVLTSRQ
jgi:hypothetical protein